MTNRYLKFLAAGSLCAVSLFSQPAGTITGLVVDEHGSPVSNSAVHVQLAGTSKSMLRGPVDLVYTDAQGRFTRQDLKFGTYEVDAMKDSDGYPDHGWLVYKDEGQPETVQLSPQNSSANITIHMSPKAGVIASVHVIDATTGRPITVTDPTSGKVLQTPGVTILREDSKDALGLPASFSRGSGVLKDILVPADVPVKIKVWADGYADWFYPGTNDPAQAQSIRVKSGQAITLDIQLHTVKAQ